MTPTHNPRVSEAAPLVVSPHVACTILNIGTTRLYQLIGAGELDTYLDGRARKITIASIHRRIARLLAENDPHASAPPRRKRGRPRKAERQAQHTAPTPSPRRNPRTAQLAVLSISRTTTPSTTTLPTFARLPARSSTRKGPLHECDHTPGAEYNTRRDRRGVLYARRKAPGAR